jgi:hypothetical protein
MFRQLPSRLGSLRNLLPLAFASVAAISLTVIVGTVILQTRAILTDQTGQALLALAESDSQRLTEELAREVELLQNLAEDKAIYSHVVAMEETSPRALSPEEQATLLQIRHEAWISQTDEAFRNSVLLNAASNELNNFVSDFPEHIQLTLTDRHGGLVAAGGVVARSLERQQGRHLCRQLDPDTRRPGYDDRNRHSGPDFRSWRSAAGRTSLSIRHSPSWSLRQRPPSRGNRRAVPGG